MKNYTGLKSLPIKTTLCLATAMLLTLSHAIAAASPQAPDTPKAQDAPPGPDLPKAPDSPKDPAPDAPKAAPNSPQTAADGPMAEIIDLVLSHQKNSASFEDGERFEQLMHQLGAADAQRSSEALRQLDPANLEDRIRLIALHRFQHHDLFDGIYHCYVRHPTEAELEKRRQERPAFPPDSAQPGSTADQRMVDPTILAPSEISPLHLTAPYLYCFEYYLISPRHEPTLKHYDAALTTALDHLKKQVKQADIRVLLQARLYAELEGHLQTLKLVGRTLYQLEERLGPPAFQSSGTLGYSFHLGGSIHAYYLAQIQEGRVSTFKRIPEDQWRTLSDQPFAPNTFFPPMKKPRPPKAK